ncbi:MAG: hypothetical protein ACOY4R_28745 [Pseudomonadota bacterium]
MQFRDAIEADARDLLGLAARIRSETGRDTLDEGLLADLEGAGNDHLRQEQRLDRAALDLRQGWLAVAHGAADHTLKSPRAGETVQVPCGDSLTFGYERDLDAALLEGRGATYASPPAGWHAETVLYRSGQAALAGLLQFAAERWATRRSLAIAHCGAYFETADLLEAWPGRVFRRREARADIVILEPVWCDGRFGICHEVPAAGRLLLIDTTLAGPGHDLTPWLSHAARHCGLAVAFSSGLKLDQAGLELANVGIVRVLSRQDEGQAAKIADRLRRLRGLMGTGLTLDEISALSAPWFMDPDYVRRYVGAVFANNRRLAAAVGTRSPLFEGHCHPGLETMPGDAPFCALRLRDPSHDAHDRLARLLRREAERRGLLLTPGGSFGFRGHRFEAIEPEPGRGEPFVRVAMGWRGGHSANGITALVEELAAFDSLEAAELACARA